MPRVFFYPWETRIVPFVRGYRVDVFRYGKWETWGDWRTLDAARMADMRLRGYMSL